MISFCPGLSMGYGTLGERLSTSLKHQGVLRDDPNGRGRTITGNLAFHYSRQLAPIV